MATWVLVAAVVIATVGHAVGQNTSSVNIYGNLPEGNYTAVSIEIEGFPGLSHLFVMAQGFVDVVFRPFSDLEEPINNIVNSDDALQYLGQNWQNVVSFEAGYVACLVFGLLFFIFVPLVGSIMCCCRCCCGNCGGRLQQSHKRSKSCWRQCLCLSMFVLTTFMAVPTIFVFLTNEWITDVVETSPIKINAILDDTSAYLNLVPRQLTYMTDQYSTVDDNIRPLVSDFGVSIGEPLKVEIEAESNDALLALNTTITTVDEVTTSINTVASSVTKLKTGTVDLDAALQTVATNLSSLTCGSGDIACEAVKTGTGDLALGFNPNDFDQLITELASVNSSINDYDLDQLYSNITSEIDNIPQKVREETQTASDDAVKTLNDTNQTISDLESQLPTDSFDQIDETINNIQNSVTNGFNSYNTYFDKYRYIAGIVLGSILALVVASYYLGMFLGICGHRTKTPTTERGAVSNCGGIMLMVGVGFSFIFSWLFMLLVIVTFTIGGHGERYGCQALEPPNYEAADLIVNLTDLDLANTLNLPDDVTLSFESVLSSCEQNQAVYQALKLEYVFNVSAYLINVTDLVKEVNTTVDESISQIDYSSIKIYSEDDQQQLLDLKDTDLNSINYTYYQDQLGTGVTKTNLTIYAAGLRASADNMNTTSAAAIVQEQADEIDRIQQDMVVPLQTDYDALSMSIDSLVDQSMMLNATIDMLDNSLVGLNESITVNGEAIASSVVYDVTNAILGNVTSYTSWVEQELTTTLGACKPVYDTYMGVLGLFCDYLIDTINGLWFSLGWCVFFLIPSAIVGMKLMKFFRRMDIEEEFEEGHKRKYSPGRLMRD